MRLKDKVAIITGTGKGIGEATAKLFAKEGAKVVGCARTFENADKVAQEIIAAGGEAIAIKVDVSKKADVDRLFQTTMEKYGRVDILINNAGITDDARLVKMTEDQFDRVVAINLKGSYLCGQAAAQIMLEQGSGVILNMASVVGVYGNFGQTNYAATKFGVIGMTKTWAKELSPKGIRVNAVAPGYIATPMVEAMPEKVLNMMREKTPLRRLGTPEDVAYAFLFLASDESSFATGAVFNLDGGLVL